MCPGSWGSTWRGGTWMRCAWRGTPSWGARSLPVDPAPERLGGSAAGAVRRLLRAWEPALVAVDAPCALACDPRGGWGRLCEALVVDGIQRRWAEVHPGGSRAPFGIARTPPEDGGRLPGWMRVGLAVFAALAAEGYPLAVGAAACTGGQRAAVEVYPDATFWLLALARDDAGASDGAPVARKRHAPISAMVADRLALLPPAVRRALLAHPGFPRSPSARIDLIDATAAAWSGQRCLAGEGRFVVGRAGEGALLLPA